MRHRSEFEINQFPKTLDYNDFFINDGNKIKNLTGPATCMNNPLLQLLTIVQIFFDNESFLLFVPSYVFWFDHCLYVNSTSDSSFPI